MSPLSRPLGGAERSHPSSGSVGQFIGAVQTERSLADSHGQTMPANSSGCMKVLYVGGERSDAKAVATALRGVARNGKVSWTSHLDHAARRIHQNADVAALVVESGVDRTNWRQVIGQVRSLASHPPGVVVTAHGLARHVESLEPEPDEYLTKDEFLMRDLVNVLKRTINEVPTHQF